MYKFYKIARDKAWETLIKTKTDSLPTNLGKIASFYGIKIRLISSENQQAFIKENTIYINQHLSKERGRFTIAHELEHILLNHKDL